MSSIAPPSAPSPGGPGARRSGRRPRSLSRGALTMFFLVAPSVDPAAADQRATRWSSPRLQSVRDGTLIVTGDFVGLANYIDVLTSADVLEGRPVHRDLHPGRGLRQLAGRAGPGAAAAHQDPGRTQSSRCCCCCPGSCRSSSPPPPGTGWSPPPTSPIPALLSEASGSASRFPRRPDPGRDHRLRVQGVGQLPVHDVDDLRRPGRRSTTPSTRPPAWTAPPAGSSSSRSRCR